MPETLQTIAAKIDALGKSLDQTIAARIDALSKSNDQRFAAVDRQLAETRAQLGVKIEAVETKVVQVYDEVIAMREEAKRNAAQHTTFAKRLDSHDLRLLALEKPGPPKS